MPLKIDISDQWQDREPTRHEQLAMQFVDKVIEEFREELEKVHGEDREGLDAIIDHAKSNIWLHLCSLCWRLDGSIPDNSPRRPTDN